MYERKSEISLLAKLCCAQAKVTYVRDEDAEYDVEYENGTVYTIKAKDVYKQTSAVIKRAERQRSKSRGRSPARSKRAQPDSPAPKVWGSNNRGYFLCGSYCGIEKSWLNENPKLFKNFKSYFSAKFVN